MNTLTTEEIVGRYVELSKAPITRCKLLVDGVLYPWFWDAWHISYLPNLLCLCPYLFGYDVKTGGHTHLDSQVEEWMSDGQKEHRQPERRGTTYEKAMAGVPALKPINLKWLAAFLNFTFERSRPLPPELLIVGKYKDITFSGRADEVIVDKNRIVSINERKRGRFATAALPQLLTYCYFYSKLFNQINFTYLTNSIPHTFDEGAVREAEGYLDIAVDYLTGKTPCEPNYDWCKESCLTYTGGICRIRGNCDKRVWKLKYEY